MVSQLDKALGVLPTAAAVQARRLEMIAGNIANATTPNYKARDVDFRAIARSHFFADIKHWCFVAFAFADDNGAIHI